MDRFARATRAAAVALASIVVSATLVGLGLSSSPAGASSTPTSSSGCGAGGVTSGILSLSVNGFTRTVIVHVPHGTTGKAPLALVLNLHGSGATAADQDVFSGMDVTADDDDFIVAYPQALIPYLTGYDWNVPGVPLVSGASVPKGAANDVKFLTSLVGQLEAKYCINPREVYATGFSGGGREVSQLACDSSKVFAAIAPVSGLRRPTPCPTKRAVPVIAFHGLADAVDPFDGHGLAYWTYSVPTAAKDWGSQDHCSSKAKVTHPDADVTLTTYTGCAGGAVVELYEITGEGHEWPGGPTMPTSLTSELGPQSNAVNANQLMWEFFAAHPLS